MTIAPHASPLETLPPQERERVQAAERRLAEVWQAPPGIGSLSAVNHTYVGRRFVITGFVFFLIGGVLALLMRAQLAVPDNELMGHELYNQLFTMHGTTMMFLFAVPILEGAAMYLIPIMIGARDLAFPRLSAYGYWCYLFGGILLYSSFFVGAAPDGGWFMYVPLTSAEYSPGMNADFWLLGVTFIEISAVSAGVELIVSILKTRTAGMSINRMPLFAWYILVTAFMIVFGFPPLILASVLLEIERAFGFPFYDAARGGDSLLWQHLFWIFGHPEVYIIFLPGAGIVSMVVPTFARRPFVGYSWAVIAAAGTGFISFGLWVHHMYAVGIPHLSLGFFSAASLAVAIAAGIQVFAWIATLWHGRPVMATPLLFVLGFLFIFVLGGLTGVMVAIVPFDWQVHDSYFVVAHFHYVLIGGMVFPLFAGLYYWLPNATGRMLSERLGGWVFWLMFVGFNVTFLPMHLTGLLGMPRRVYTYPGDLGWDTLNMVSSVGAFVFALGVLIFLLDFARHFRFGRPAGENPWNAGTLEWLTPTPIPPYNFRSLPPVESRYPLWDQPDLARDVERGVFFLAEVRAGRRETLGTTTIDAHPEQIVLLPGPTWLPLIAALATALFFTSFLLGAYLVSVLGVGLTVATLLVWLWQTEQLADPDMAEVGRGISLPVHAAGPHPAAWWGLFVGILADAAMFASLVFAYFYLWTFAPEWPPGRTIADGLLLPGAGVVALLLSSAAIFWARRGHPERRAGRLRLGLVLALLLALAFAALQWVAVQRTGLAPQEHAYAALVWTLIGFSLTHVAIAVLMGAFTLVRSLAGHVTDRREIVVHNTALFWHYTVGQGVVTAAVVFLFPLLV